MGPSSWCRLGELNSALHVFSVTCDRYTKAAWISRQDSNLNSSVQSAVSYPVRRRENGTADGSRTR